MDLKKVEHFYDYLTDSSLLREEAYGSTTIKFDSGKK